ncbi:hypothetical protein [Sphingomonas sp. RB1R13]|uniref:hypothetical protein n=1 Tax=Sphingomonas sp. RB1R13 TaxID=3096159 RepID=UPI002FCB427C
MLVKVIDAVRHCRREAERSGDICAARAASDNQLLGDLVAVFQDVADGHGAARQRGGLGGARSDEVNGRSEPCPDGLITLLEGAVIGFVKFADARGVAAASKVLEQERVIKVVKVLQRQAKRAANVAAYPAGAKTVPGGLPFGNVQRVTERTDQLGQRDGVCRCFRQDRYELHDFRPLDWPSRDIVELNFD